MTKNGFDISDVLFQMQPDLISYTPKYPNITTCAEKVLIVGSPPPRCSGRGANEISKMGPVGASRKKRLAPLVQGGQTNISDVPFGGGADPPSNYGSEYSYNRHRSVLSLIVFHTCMLNAMIKL